MSTNPQRFITPEEYLEIERASEERNEYYAGEMFLMSGGSPNHNAIIFNISGALRAQIKGGPCRGFAQSQRVLVDNAGLYTYPDVVIVCGQPLFAHGDTLTNPTLIVEVLSRSTENYDKGKKFDLYRQLASFVEYLLVAQDRCHVLHYIKQANHKWELTELFSMDETISLPSFDARLSLRDVYDNVDFTELLEEQQGIVN